MSGAKRTRRPAVNWQGDPPLRAFVTSVKPAAAKLIRRIRDAMNARWPRESESGGVTDKGVVAEAISAGLHALAGKHLGELDAWPASTIMLDLPDVTDCDEMDDGLYVPVFVSWDAKPSASERENYEEQAAEERILERRKRKEERRAARTGKTIHDDLAKVIDLKQKRAERPPRGTP